MSESAPVDFHSASSLAHTQVDFLSHSALCAPCLMKGRPPTSDLFNLPQGFLGEVRAWASGGGARAEFSRIR
jgi:hypothetical protein